MLDNSPSLPAIPVIDTTAAFPLETLAAKEPYAHLLMDSATRFVPRTALRGLDVVSRRWLTQHANGYLDEIDAISKRLARPGAYFLAVNYEWGCTVGVGPSPDGGSARLARTLDWGIEGLGRHLIAARVKSPVGPFIALTWPGFTGVMQAMAHGRFSGALNQAPMRRLGGGLIFADWAANRARVWRMPHQLAGHLLRRVFEESRTYAEARDRLIREPIAAPATFTLAGLKPTETCVIERTETQAHVVDGRAAAANHWQGLDHGARARGLDSEGRQAAMMTAMMEAGHPEFATEFPWLVAPILNDTTRLVMIADAAAGRISARGYEGETPVTALLDLR